MSELYALTIGQNAITTAVMVAAPILIASMVIGLLISIFQAVTQIQEQTLTFVPKLVAAIVVFLVLGPWMMNTLIQFIKTMFDSIPYVIR